jgi:hypothetical protein
MDEVKEREKRRKKQEARRRKNEIISYKCGFEDRDLDKNYDPRRRLKKIKESSKRER